MSQKDISEWEVIERDGNVWSDTGPFSWKASDPVEYYRYRRAIRRLFRLSRKPMFHCICLRKESYTEADIGVLIDLEDGLFETDSDDYD